MSPTLRFKLLWCGVFAVAALVIMAIAWPERAESAPPARLQPYDLTIKLWIDPDTGCEYLIREFAAAVAITPRLAKDAAPKCR